MLQAMIVSTDEKRRKSEGREYESPPPIPCTPKELGMLLDKWIVDGVFKPNKVFKEPTKEEQRDPCFYCLHNYVQHATAKCLALRRLVHNRIREGNLELSQLEVQRNPLPNNNRNGVATFVICTNSSEEEEERLALPAATMTTLQKSSRFQNLFDQLELTKNE